MNGSQVRRPVSLLALSLCPLLAQSPNPPGATPPDVVYKIEGKYTPRAREAQIRCKVVMEFVISAAGTPEDVRVRRPCAVNIVDAMKKSLPPIEDVARLGAAQAELANAEKDSASSRESAAQVADEAERERLLGRARQLEARTLELKDDIAAYRSKIAAEQARREGLFELSPEAKDGAVDLDESATAAVKQWKFKPAILDGQPIPFQAFVEMNFDLV